ncbi:hypothetical protein LX90_008932 [Lentzea flava]|nr:hypothetical protein [Lentzea flava]
MLEAHQGSSTDTQATAHLFRFDLHTEPFILRWSVVPAAKVRITKVWSWPRFPDTSKHLDGAATGIAQVHPWMYAGQPSVVSVPPRPPTTEAPLPCPSGYTRTAACEPMPCRLSGPTTTGGTSIEPATTPISSHQFGPRIAGAQRAEYLARSVPAGYRQPGQRPPVDTRVDAVESGDGRGPPYTPAHARVPAKSAWKTDSCQSRPFCQAPDTSGRRGQLFVHRRHTIGAVPQIPCSSPKPVHPNGGIDPTSRHITTDIHTGTPTGAGQDDTHRPPPQSQSVHHRTTSRASPAPCTKTRHRSTANSPGYSATPRPPPMMTAWAPPQRQVREMHTPVQRPLAGVDTLPGLRTTWLT